MTQRLRDGRNIAFSAHIEINLQTLPRVFTHGAKCNIPITPTMTVAIPGNREGTL